MNITIIISIVVFALGILAISRLLIGLIVANLHQLKSLDRQATSNKTSDFKVSVVIPAFNEEKLIKRCVESVVNQTYPHIEIITVNDGSTDKTLSILQQLADRYPQVQVVDQPNSGKAVAINRAVKEVASGDLVTILDADSAMTRTAIEKMARRFEDQRVVGVSSNVRISKPHNFIEWVQKIEYLLGYRLKGSEEILGIEYIIGGVGSTYRRSAMLEVGGYDTDSVTEDIAFTMKMIAHFGNKNKQFGYADDVLVYTPPVRNFSQLLKQRYRWKYGRFKALFKYKQLLFSRSDKYTRTLTWWKLPKVFFEEFIMLIEPLVLGWMMGLIFHFGDLSTIISILACYFIFAIASVIPENLKSKERWQLTALSPAAYGCLYVINIIDWISLIRCLARMKTIAQNTDKVSKWQHVDR